MYQNTHSRVVHVLAILATVYVLIRLELCTKCIYQHKYIMSLLLIISTNFGPLNQEKSCEIHEKNQLGRMLKSKGVLWTYIKLLVFTFTFTTNNLLQFLDARKQWWFLIYRSQINACISRWEVLLPPLFYRDMYGTFNYRLALEKSI